MTTIKKVTVRTQIWLSEERAKQLFSCGKEKEATEVLDENYFRRENNVVNLNKCFSNGNVKDISDYIFRCGKYDGSDFESDASINYEEGYGIDYHENDNTEIKKQIKKVKDKKLLMKGWKKQVNQY